MRPISASRTLGALAFAVLLASDARGQSGAAAPVPTFGTVSSSVVRFGFAEFTPVVSTTPFDYDTTADHTGRFTTQVGALLMAIPHLPTGAHLETLELDFCDNDPANHVVLALSECDMKGGDCNAVGAVQTTNLGAIHCGVTSTTLSYTVKNSTRSLYLGCFLNSGSISNILNGAAIYYRLQVSAAPAVATFTDVPTSSPQFQFVEALVAAGITAGCGSGNYCPNAPITRGQMAVFLSSALGLHFAN